MILIKVQKKNKFSLLHQKVFHCLLVDIYDIYLFKYTVCYIFLIINGFKKNIYIPKGQGNISFFLFHFASAVRWRAKEKGYIFFLFL